MQRLKNTIYRFVSALSRTASPVIRKNTVLIIKTDEIGDYVLWRNVLTCIRNSRAFKDHKITLIGNVAWRDLALSFDGEYVDEFIWLDKNKFKSDLRYRYSFLSLVRKKGFEKLVNAIFSRSPGVDDAIATVCDKTYKIAMARNEHNVAPFEKGYDKDLYQEIHSLPLTGLFEFDRNCRFTSMFIKEACEPTFGFNLVELTEGDQMPGKYAVIFPGSGRSDRRWSTANFAEVAEFLHREKGREIVLAGGPGDKAASDEVARLLSFPVTDITGETSLTEFVSVLGKADLLVSVDTGAVHLAAAVGCKVYGLFNGDQYGRFAPYPSNHLRNHFSSFYPDELEIMLSSDVNIHEKYQYISPFHFDLTTPAKVISKIEQLQ